MKSNKERRDRYRRVEGIWVRSHKTSKDKARTLRRKWSLFLELKSCFKVNRGETSVRINAMIAHLVVIGKVFSRMKSKKMKFESQVAADRASLLFLKPNM